MHHNSGFQKTTHTKPQGKHNQGSGDTKRNEKRKEWQRDDKRARYA